MNTATLTIPNLQLELTVEQLITAARQLPAGDRAKLAHALVESDLEVELTQVIAELYSQPPVDEISDEEILAGIAAVRRRHHFIIFPTLR